MVRFFSRLLGRLSVGRKLLLIYLLDLSAVIFISAILINEKFIAIDFARKEIAGNAYIAVVRDALLDVSRAAQPGASATDLARHVTALREAEGAYGEGMQSSALGIAFAGALGEMARSAPAQRAPLAADALEKGRALVTRVGNQSNLILDPDLDSYYTMSLLLLRFPDLLDIEMGITDRLAAHGTAMAGGSSGERTQYLIQEGRLDAVAKGIESDYSEAFAAGKAPLAQALDPTRKALAGAIDAYRTAARRYVDGAMADELWPAVAAARVQLLATLGTTWKATTDEMQRLLDARVHGFFVRMWLHLGTALLLLGLLLTAVFFVARQIARPLGHLADVADRVSRSGDYSLRARWASSDEIGRLVTAFNDMLDKLDRNRRVEQELAASARAAAAQQELVDAIPIPLVVTSIPGTRCCTRTSRRRRGSTASARTPGSAASKAARARGCSSNSPTAARSTSSRSAGAAAAIRRGRCSPRVVSRTSGRMRCSRPSRPSIT